MAEEQWIKPFTAIPELERLQAQERSIGRQNNNQTGSEKTEEDSTIDHPWHYHGGTVYEAIKVIEAWSLGFNLGNTVKYLSRAGRKTEDKLKDLKKAAWYLNREIETLEKQ